MDKFYRISPTRHGWGYGYGFFSNYRICLEQLILHKESGMDTIPYIDWSGTTWVEGFNPFESTHIVNDYNPFDQWFDQQIPQPGDEIIECTIPSNPDILDHSKDYFDSPDQLHRQQLVDKQYLKIKQPILDKVSAIWDKEFAGHTVLGVMARGTENYFHHPMYGIFTVDDYIKGIQKILQDNPQITKIFLASEDMEYISAMHAAFPQSYFIPDVFRTTDETMEYMNAVHCWMNVSTKRNNHCKLLGEETIIQAKLLSKCDYIFGKHGGVIAGSVLWNEKLKRIFKI